MSDLETLIRDWYWDEGSYQFAREAGAFLLQFINHFNAAGTRPSEIQQHLNNVWLIGALLCQSNYGQSFSPAAFLNKSSFLDEFYFGLQGFPEKIASYENTWRELTRYVRGMGYGD